VSQGLFSLFRVHARAAPVQGYAMTYRDTDRVRKRVRAEKRLKAKDLTKLEPGTHEDGGGLRLWVDPDREDGTPGARRWQLRVSINGKRLNRGLGAYPLVSLDDARDQASDIRRAARTGRDLIAEEEAQRAMSVTFKQAFESMFELRKKQLSNAKHMGQWTSTMETYVFPTIGKKAVSDVTHADILAILEPIWFEKAETARRVLQRLELVFKSAILRGQREKASPCIGVAEELGVKHLEVEHHRAMPYAEVPGFIQMLRESPCHDVTKLAFEWLILTATRSGETRGAHWDEIDGKAALGQSRASA